MVFLSSQPCPLTFQMCLSKPLPFFLTKNEEEEGSHAEQKKKVLSGLSASGLWWWGVQDSGHWWTPESTRVRHLSCLDGGGVVSPGCCGFQGWADLSQWWALSMAASQLWALLWASFLQLSFSNILGIYLLRSFETRDSRALKVTDFPASGFQTKLRL